MSERKNSYLSVEEFEALMDRYKSGDKSALDLMVEDMQNLITYEIYTFGRRYAAYFGRENFRQELNNFLVKKIVKYKKIEGGSFIKYFIFCLKKHFIDLRRQLNATIKEREKTKSFDNYWKNNDDNDKSLEKTYNSKTFSEDAFLDEIEVSRIRENVLPLIPKNYRDVAEMYYFDKKNTTQIAKIMGLSKSSVGYRLQRANEEIKNIIMTGEKNVENTNIHSPNKTQANRISRIAPIMSEASKVLDFEEEFLPLLTDKQKVIFKNYILNYTGQSLAELMELSGCKTEQEFGYANTSIKNKLNYAVYKKQIIMDFLKRFSSVEECTEVSKILNERQQILLNNYVLSLDYFAESKTAKLLNINVNSVSPQVNGLKNQIDYILMRKKMAEEFISMNYGEDFLLNKFGKTLSTDHFNVLRGYMMDYHYLCEMDFNRKIGKGRAYSSQAETLIMKKLDEYYKKHGPVLGTRQAPSAEDKTFGE